MTTTTALKGLAAAISLATAGLTGYALHHNGTDSQSTVPTASAVAYACWDEPNSDMPSGWEPICGPRFLAPASSTHFRSYSNMEDRIVLQEQANDDPDVTAPMDKLVADLKAHGWTVDPTDQCECLYPPAQH